jgi:uncharacterized RDD family membrane protein YckC
MDETPVVGRRIGAAIIDALIMTGVFFGLAAATGNIESGDGSFKVSLEGGPFLLFVAIQLAYFFVLETVAGKTIGKAVLGLRVVAQDGAKASGGQVAGRTILRIVDALPVFYIVGLIAVAISPRDQRIGDRAAHTRVVRG